MTCRGYVHINIYGVRTYSPAALAAGTSILCHLIWLDTGLLQGGSRCLDIGRLIGQVEVLAVILGSAGSKGVVGRVNRTATKCLKVYQIGSVWQH